MYDAGNPQHLAYLDGARSVMDRVTVAMKMHDELRTLRDCGVLRVTSQACLDRFMPLVEGNLAIVIKTDAAGFAHIRLSIAGKLAAAKL